MNYICSAITYSEPGAVQRKGCIDHGPSWPCIFVFVYLSQLPNRRTQPDVKKMNFWQTSIPIDFCISFHTIPVNPTYVVIKTDHFTSSHFCVRKIISCKHFIRRASEASEAFSQV